MTSENENKIAANQNPPYMRFLGASMRHALINILRRKRTLLAGAFVLLPVVIPLALAAFTQNSFGNDGNKIFVKMLEELYLKALAPLLALYFGATLIGEDIENRTIPYLLTRPIPRSALVIGRFMAYIVVIAGLFIPAIFLTFIACTSLGGFPLSAGNIKFMLHYDFAIISGLIAYGAFCVCLGTFFKRPAITGIITLFAWQRLANIVPGVVDFLTIEKYITALLPPLAEARQSIDLNMAGYAQYQKEEFLIGATKSSIMLLLITVAMIALSIFILRWREYSQAKAVEG